MRARLGHPTQQQLSTSSGTVHVAKSGSGFWLQNLQMGTCRDHPQHIATESHLIEKAIPRPYHGSVSVTSVPGRSFLHFSQVSHCAHISSSSGSALCLPCLPIPQNGLLLILQYLEQTRGTQTRDQTRDPKDRPGWMVEDWGLVIGRGRGLRQRVLGLGLGLRLIFLGAPAPGAGAKPLATST